MEQVEEICDRIVLMNKGKNILDGTVNDAKQQFKQNIFSLKLQGENPMMQAEAFNVVRQDAHECTVKINEGFSPNDVLLHFIRQNITVLSFIEILPSLNDIFIQLVEGTPTARKFENTTH
jgi:ABC-2 type transport system ATP-binding protein